MSRAGNADQGLERGFLPRPVVPPRPALSAVVAAAPASRLANHPRWHMILYLLVALVVAFGIRYLCMRYRRAAPESRHRLLRTWAVYGLAAAMLLLVLTGRMHWLFAVFGVAMPWLSRILQARRMWHNFHAKARKDSADAAGEGRATGRMSRAEALQILGLEEEASEEEIIAAHRRLISRVHPDKGGSGHLAQSINRARATLLGE